VLLSILIFASLCSLYYDLDFKGHVLDILDIAILFFLTENILDIKKPLAIVEK